MTVLFASFLLPQQLGAQGISVTSASTGTVVVPASQLSHVSPDGGLTVILSDGRDFTLDADAVIEAFEGEFDSDDIMPGTLPYMVETSTGHFINVGQLSCQRLPSLNIPRVCHQLFPSEGGVVAVGGHTTGFVPTATAEFFDGTQWTSLTVPHAHDDGFSVRLANGGYLVGCGYKEEKGQMRTRYTSLYDPSTRTFTEGPLTNMNRSRAKAVLLDGSVFVSGNWQYDLTGRPSKTPPFDIYDGNSFSVAGAQLPRSHPYLLPIEDKEIIEFGTLDYFGKPVPTAANGNFLADRCYPALQELYYQEIPVFNTWPPLELPADARATDGQSKASGNAYVVACNAEGIPSVVVLEFTSTGLKSERYQVPAVYPPTSDSITFRGGSFVSDSREEAYFVGSCRHGDQWTLYLMTFSFNFMKRSFTVGTAGPFPFNPATASWTLLPDDRLLLCGGSADDDEQPVPEAYILTPLRPLYSQVAGSSATFNVQRSMFNVPRPTFNVLTPDEVEVTPKKRREMPEKFGETE